MPQSLINFAWVTRSSKNINSVTKKRIPSSWILFYFFHHTFVSWNQLTYVIGWCRCMRGCLPSPSLIASKSVSMQHRCIFLIENKKNHTLTHDAVRMDVRTWFVAQRSLRALSLTRDLFVVDPLLLPSFCPSPCHELDALATRTMSTSITWGAFVFFQRVWGLKCYS